MRRQLSIIAAMLTVLMGSTRHVTASTIVYEQLPSAGCCVLVPPNGFQSVDDFVLTGDALITALQWWGRSVAGADDFLFTLYADSGGALGTVLTTTEGSLSKTTVDVDPLPLVENFLTYYSSTLVVPFSATAGTTYWLSIFNQAADASWAWQHAGPHGNDSLMRPHGSSPWDIYQTDRAFQLVALDASPVPEPSTMLLLGTGLAGLGARRWRRHK